MKMTKYLLLSFIAVLLLFITPTSSISAADEERVAVYFKEEFCIVCQSLSGKVGTTYTESDDYIKKLEAQGVTVYIFTTDDLFETAPAFTYTDVDGVDVIPTSADLYQAFNTTYGYERGTVPVIYVGDTYFEGYADITTAIDNQEIYNLSVTPLKDVNVVEGQIYSDLTGVWGFFLVIGGGLLDGFNPCAIALLLLFISLLGFTDNKKTLFLVSLVYIVTIFVSYYIMGAYLYTIILTYQKELSIISQIISWFIFILCFILFVVNLYDYIQAKKENYGKIKNQLPKWVQRMNKKIVKTFTNAIDGDNKKGLISVLGLTVALGFILSLTELVCTGQVYLGIIYGLTLLDSAYAYLLLFIYNLMFIAPLIIIATIAIKDNSTNGVANWIREHMKNIKLGNAILFFVITLFFMSRIDLFSPMFDPLREFILFIKRSFE